MSVGFALLTVAVREISVHLLGQGVGKLINKMLSEALTFVHSIQNKNKNMFISGVLL